MPNPAYSDALKQVILEELQTEYVKLFEKRLEYTNNCARYAFWKSKENMVILSSNANFLKQIQKHRSICLQSKKEYQKANKEWDKKAKENLKSLIERDFWNLINQPNTSKTVY